MCALLQVTIRLAEEADEIVLELLTTLAEMMGIFYSKEDSRNPKQVLQLTNLLFKHALAVRTVLTPLKTMTNRKLYGIYHYSAVHHPAVICRLVCLSSINAELYERFFDRILDITRKTWSKQEETVLSAGVQQPDKPSALYSWHLRGPSRGVQVPLFPVKIYSCSLVPRK